MVRARIFFASNPREFAPIRGFEQTMYDSIGAVDFLP